MLTRPFVREAARALAAPARARALLGAVAAVSLLAAAVASCSLGNVSHSDCNLDAECVSAFGGGSKCQDGFCSTPKTCDTGKDCVNLFGGGSCVSHVCVAACDGKSKDGTPCICSPETTTELLRACTDATCVHFDNARVKKLLPGGKLPPLPPPGAADTGAEADK